MIRLTAALAVGVLALSALVFTKAREEGGLRRTLAAQEACQDALATDDLSVSLIKCPAPVAQRHRAAVQAEVCDAALLTGELFLQRSACSTEVKTLAANREAETRRADSLAEVLKQERAGQAAAITRAERRARSETERKLRADIALSSAPRRPDPRGGDLLVLDADVLRQLRDEDAAAAPR